MSSPEISPLIAILRGVRPNEVIGIGGALIRSAPNV